MAYCLRRLVNIAIMTVTYKLTRNPVLGTGIFLVYIKVAPRGTKTINMTGYYFNLLYPLIDKPTRVTDSSATLIDNIFTNELCHNLTCGILFNDISDHLPIFVLCEYNIKRNIVKEFQHIRKITEDTLASLSNELSQQSWDNVLNINDVNQAYDNFLYIFIDIFKKHCPLKRVSRKSYTSKNLGSPKV